MTDLEIIKCAIKRAESHLGDSDLMLSRVMDVLLYQIQCVEDCIKEGVNPE